MLINFIDLVKRSKVVSFILVRPPYIEPFEMDTNLIIQQYGFGNTVKIIKVMRNVNAFTFA